MSKEPKNNFKKQLKSNGYINNWKLNCIAVTGLLIFGLGVNLCIYQDLLTTHSMESFIRLKPNTFLSDYWENLPIQIPTNVYFFNWTNPLDFYNSSVKPKFTQMGPYRYLQKMKKVNVSWNENNTVTFQQVRHFYFDDKGKNGNLSDAITTLNAVEVLGSHYLQNWEVVIRTIIQSALISIDPDYYITKIAKEHIEGYHNGVIDLLQYFEHLAPEIPRFDKVGWLRVINGTTEYEGTFNIQTGLNRNFDVLRWNHQNVNPFYEEGCNKIQGSMGEINSFQTTKKYLYLFVPHVCRTVRLDFAGEVVIGGILGHKYSALDGVFDNGSKVAGNECFCAGKCIPSGLLNVSPCRYGLNAYYSLPHYFNADPIYLKAVEGLDPEKIKHEAYLVIEPVTYIVLDYTARVQLNAFVHPVEGFSLFHNVSEIYFPILWLEQTVTFPENLKSYLQYFINLPHILHWVSVIFIAIGALIFCFWIYKIHLQYLLKKNRLFKEFSVTKQESEPLNEKTIVRDAEVSGK